MPARPPLTTRMLEATRDSGRCACKPHGEKVARKKSDVRYKLARRGGSACPRTSRLPSQAYVL